MAWLATRQTLPSRTVLDLGAHIGGFSLHLAHARSPAAIYAIEANPDNFKLLQQNVAANHAGQIITPMHCAAGDRDGVRRWCFRATIPAGTRSRCRQTA